MPRLLLFLLPLVLTGCSANRPGDGEEGRLYSYVDAQGNLVTMSRKESGDVTGKGPDQAAARQEASGAELDGERYQTLEEVEKKLEEEQRDRFVTYIGPEGEVVRRPLDLVAEREAVERREPGYEALDPADQYLETMSRVPVDCCAHLTETAVILETGKQERASFAPGAHGWIGLDESRPAVAFRLGEGVRSFRLASYIHKDRFLKPHLLFLDRAGRPVLKVNNVFTRQYAENWHRFGYFEGVLPVAAEHAWVVVYLPYGRLEASGPAESVVPEDGIDEVSLEGARASLRGELVLFGRDRPVSGGN